MNWWFENWTISPFKNAFIWKACISTLMFALKVDFWLGSTDKTFKNPSFDMLNKEDGSKFTNHKPPAWPSELVAHFQRKEHETNTSMHRLWIAHFNPSCFFLSDQNNGERLLRYLLCKAMTAIKSHRSNTIRSRFFLIGILIRTVSKWRHYWID